MTTCSMPLLPPVLDADWIGEDGQRYFELGSPLTCLLAPGITGLQPYGVQGVGPGWLASPLAAFGLAHQERAYPAGTRRGVAQQRRDRSESQVAHRGPFHRHSEERHQLVITIGIDPHKSSLTAVAVEPDGQPHPPIRLVVDQTHPGRAAHLGAPSGPSVSGRSRAPPGSAAASPSSSSPPASSSSTSRPSWPPSTAAGIEQRPQDRRRRRDLGRRGRPAQPAPQPRPGRGPHHDHASAHRAPRRPGRRAHPLASTASTSCCATCTPAARRGAPRHHRRLRAAGQDPPGHRGRPTAQSRSPATSCATSSATTASIKELEKQLRAAVTASGTTLTQIQGIGVLTAAKILALTGDIRRFPNQEHYASYAGTAPIDVSSGDQETHRLIPARQPAAQRRHPRRRRHPSPRSRTRTRSLPTQDRRTQDRQGSPPQPQTTHLKRRLPPHPGRPSTPPTTAAA